MSLPLNVPYNEKEEAKRLGAFWNSDLKLWTIPDHIKDVNPFQAWLPLKAGYIIRKPYLLCLSKTTCWKCRKETPMIALGAKNYFYYDNLWVRANSPTLFSYVTAVDDKVLAYLNQHYPFFQQKYSSTIGRSYFANTCSFCGSLQGDFHNHEDFGGAFLLDPFQPKPSHVKLVSLEFPFDYQLDAQGGGMAYDQIFFPENTARSQSPSVKAIIF